VRVSPGITRRIWGDEGYRVFLSHKAEVKAQAAALKDKLRLFGMSCFVAHQDIEPTKEWQGEIENALMSMDAFVALLTENYHDSNWTDQEVGFAICRDVPIIAVKLGLDPYGFIGKFQALSGHWDETTTSWDWDEAAMRIARLLIKQPRMLDAYIAALPKCFSFEDGNTLSQILPKIKKLTNEQAKAMMSAYNQNLQLRGSWGFNGTRPSQFGDGLAVHLSRATGKKYVMKASGEITKKVR